MRREMVRTNCPTAAEKPERKALNGLKMISSSSEDMDASKGAALTYIVAANDAVDELHSTVQCDVEEEDIEEQCSRGSVLDVAVPNMKSDLLRR